MQLSELPRDDSGAVVGLFRLRHRLPDFSASLVDVHFEQGSTTAPLGARVLERVMAAFGDAVSAEPWPVEQRPPVAEVPAAAPARPAPTPLTVVAAPGPPLTARRAPTTSAELRALPERELRALVSEMGEDASSWGKPRMRRFIAEELGIEES